MCDALLKRDIPQPSALARYPGDILTSARSAAVQPVTTTSIVTSTSTTTGATYISTMVVATTTLVTETVNMNPTVIVIDVATETACVETYKFVVASGSLKGRNGKAIRSEFTVAEFDVTYGVVSYADFRCDSLDCTS